MELTSRQIAQFSGISPGRLRRWRQKGLLPDRGSFLDLRCARAIASLLKQGFHLIQVERAVTSVRRWLDSDDLPILHLTLGPDGRLAYRWNDGLLDPLTGQLFLDSFFSANPAPSLDQLLKNAAEAFFKESYSDAADLYRRCLELSPNDPKIWYDFANALDEEGACDAAAHAYIIALQLNPDFADAHFNFALFWERQGQSEKARPHFLRYLELDPQSSDAFWIRILLLNDRPQNFS